MLVDIVLWISEATQFFDIAKAYWTEKAKKNVQGSPESCYAQGVADGLGLAKNTLLTMLKSQDPRTDEDGEREGEEDDSRG